VVAALEARRESVSALVREHVEWALREHGRERKGEEGDRRE
jgi:hypothetical protein